MIYLAFSFAAIRLLRKTPYSRSYSVATTRTPSLLAMGSMIQVGEALMIWSSGRLWERYQAEIFFSAGLEIVIVFKKSRAEIGLFQRLPAGRGGKSGKERGFFFVQNHKLRITEIILIEIIIYARIHAVPEVRNPVHGFKGLAVGQKCIVVRQQELRVAAICGLCCERVIRRKQAFGIRAAVWHIRKIRDREWFLRQEAHFSAVLPADRYIGRIRGLRCLRDCFVSFGQRSFLL